MVTANSSAVLPSVEVLSSGGKSDELVQLIRKLANGLVKEFNPDGNLNWKFIYVVQFNLLTPMLAVTSHDEHWHLFVF